MSKILFTFAALAAATAVPAAANIPHDSGTRIVRYADLDLNSAAGRVRLEQRIGAAVRAVCGFAVPGDLRSVTLAVTDKGRQVHERIKAQRAAAVSQAARKLPAQEHDALIAALGTLEHLAEELSSD